MQYLHILTVFNYFLLKI